MGGHPGAVWVRDEFARNRTTGAPVAAAADIADGLRVAVAAAGASAQGSFREGLQARERLGQVDPTEPDPEMVAWDVEA